MNQSSNRWILLVDDDLEFRTALAESLTQFNYLVVTAAAPREAIQKLNKQAFFCVICDLKLGDESGEAVIEYIRESTRAGFDKRTPVLAVSGYLDREVAARIGKLINGAVVKPFKVEQIVAKLKQIEEALGGQKVA